MDAAGLQYAAAHTVSVVVFSLVFIVLTRSLWLVIYNLFFHPLRQFPGPKSWAASVVPLVWNQLLGKDFYTILDLHRQYGAVVRTAPDELSYADAIVYRDAFAHRQGHDEFGKSRNFGITPPNGVNGILFANREDHSRYRRAFAASFSERGMQRQQPLIRRFVDLLMNGLRERSGEGAQDMTAWFNWASFDIISMLTFGDSFGCLEHQRTHPWIEAVFGNIKSVAVIRAARRLGIEGLLPYIAPKKAVEGRIRNYQFSHDQMASRVQMGTNKGDFLDPVLEKNGKEGGLAFDELVSNGSNLILAGSETTATLLSGAVYQLCKHPKALRKAVEEVRNTFSSVDEINLFSTAKLKYTLAVLNETMRIYPPVPNQPSRASPPGGETIDGKYIPGGTTIYVSQYVMCHLENFWHKPEEFHPERFLKDEAWQAFDNDDHSIFQPFSVGPRNCIGRNLAYAEMRLILTRLLFEFDMELDERSDTWTFDQRAFALWEKPPLWVNLKSRIKS